MADKLVIVESPAKSKTIGKILGPGFLVRSSMGHIRDLPVKNIGVDVKDSFKPKYVLVKGRDKVVDELKKAAQKVDEIYLAPDPDREGEAIAWHLKELLGGLYEGKKFYRIHYNEITAQAVRHAIDNPGEIDLNMVNAQQARRVLDRLVGYMVSPLLWSKLRRGLSAGRVQSVALRLVCEREDEIKKFVSKDFWVIGAMLKKLVDPRDQFKVKLLRINDKKADVQSTDEAETVRADLKASAYVVGDITKREVTRRPYPPFKTSSLQQSAFSAYGYSPSRTMIIAQKLYEGMDLGEGPVGLITYMRTDSFNIAKEALDSVRNFIGSKYGAEYMPEKPNFYKGRAGAQEAHEAIRPTDVNRTPESLEKMLDPSDFKLYRLIWQRFVASQMTPAKIGLRTVKINAARPGGENSYLLQATASQVTFPGYMKLTGVDIVREKEKEQDEEFENVPEVAVGEKLECVDVMSELKKTQPPPRYSESSLIKALESNGVGRPSTYAQIIYTLHARAYVEKQSKSLAPTELGSKVSSILVSCLNELFDVKFTATMEKSLDEVEFGKLNWTKMLSDFYAVFVEWLDKAKEPPADSGIVLEILAAVEKVKDWKPEVKQGKRTFSDQKFVVSIRKQIGVSKPVSKRQLDTLYRIAKNYTEVLPSLGGILEKAKLLGGHESLSQEPQPEVIQKLAIIKKVEMSEGLRKFIDSLDARVGRGYPLSPKQVQALDTILLANAKNIPDFETIKGALNIVVESDPQSSEDIKLMLADLVKVDKWKDPVKRGRMVFDDKKFYESLDGQFKVKGFISEKQYKALGKLHNRYFKKD